MDYILVLSRKYPNVLASCSGAPEIYEHILWEGGDPMPTDQELIDANLGVEQDVVWEDIKKERDRRKAGGVKVGAKWFHSDDTSRIQQIGLVMFGANIPPNLLWKTMDSSFVTMTQTVASQIFQATAFSDQGIFKIAEQKKAEMLTLSDPYSYNIYVGWPLIFGE